MRFGCVLCRAAKTKKGQVLCLKHTYCVNTSEPIKDGSQTKSLQNSRPHQDSNLPNASRERDSAYAMHLQRMHSSMRSERLCERRRGWHAVMLKPVGALALATHGH
jgi:hypothetical protein